jgi:hypothetical protein
MLQQVCDTSGSHLCVQCTTGEPAVCGGLTPACIDATCRSCTAHAQCTASSACLPDGSCADAMQVAYVDPMATDGTECSLPMPCTRIAAALATKRPYVKLRGTIDEAIAIADRDVVVLSEPGTRLKYSKNGLPVEVRGSSHVQVYDLEVTGASGPSDAILLSVGMPSLELHRAAITSNTSHGISVTAGTLTVTDSTLTGNNGGAISMSSGALTLAWSIVSKNSGGGVTVSGGQFAIVGNVFYSNGSASTTTGGVNLQTGPSAMNRLEFNSFHGNQAATGIGAAVHCTVGGGFTARNNAMFNNGTFSNPEQVGGGCSHVYSIVQPGTLPGGAGNLAVDPRFADITRGDLHLLPMSPAIGAADPAADLTGIAARDLDGDARTRPADIGADVYRAPGAP